MATAARDAQTPGNRRRLYVIFTILYTARSREGRRALAAFVRYLRCTTVRPVGDNNDDHLHQEYLYSPGGRRLRHGSCGGLLFHRPSTQDPLVRIRV